MRGLLFILMLCLCCITIYHLWQIGKINISEKEWGYLTEEEEKRKESFTHRSIAWGTLYVVSLLAFCFSFADF